MRLQHRSQYARRLCTPLVICLGLSVSLSAALAEDKRALGTQSSGLNIIKPRFPIWRTITLGTHKGVDAYRDALDAAGIKIGDAADEILGRPRFLM
jgi:hypothetical protein